MEVNGYECTGEGSVRFGEEMIRLSSVVPLPALSTVSVPQTTYGQLSGEWWVRDGRDLKENGHGLMVLISRNWHGKHEKSTEILEIASMSAKVPNRLLPNTRIDSYHHASLCDIQPVSYVLYVKCTYIYCATRRFEAFLANWGEERLMWRPRPSVRSSVCDLVSATKFIVGFSLNSVQELFAESCRTN
jgi:hypothetical protein